MKLEKLQLERMKILKFQTELSKHYSELTLLEKEIEEMNKMNQDAGLKAELYRVIEDFLDNTQSVIQPMISQLDEWEREERKK